MALLICELLTGSYPQRCNKCDAIQTPTIYSVVVAVFLQLIINCVMYRNEGASDPLINKQRRQSLPSFCTIVDTGDRVLLFLISSCVTEVKVQGGSLNWPFFWTNIL